MQNRRSFLAGIATGTAGTLLLPQLHAQTSLPATNDVSSVHTSYARIIVKHLRKMTKNSAHDPLASGELITAYRMHCDALQASGINAIATERLRTAPVPLVLSAADVEQHYPTLHKLGIHLTTEQQRFITQHITAAGAAIAPNVQAGVQTNSILKVQRSMHGLMLQTKNANATTMNTGIGERDSRPHHTTALWSPYFPSPDISSGLDGNPGAAMATTTGGMMVAHYNVEMAGATKNVQAAAVVLRLRMGTVSSTRKAC